MKTLTNDLEDSEQIEWFADFVSRLPQERIKQSLITILLEVRENNRKKGYDTLTGLLNRDFLEENLPYIIARAERGHRSVLLFIDLDRFKAVNDKFGHFAGNSTIKGIAEFLKSKLRPEDILVRFGGDEFVAVVAGGLEQAKIAVARIVQEFQKTVFSIHFNVGLSIGMVPIQRRACPQGLMMQADKAMYRAKKFGGNQFRICYGGAAPRAAEG